MGSPNTSSSSDFISARDEEEKDTDLDAMDSARDVFESSENAGDGAEADKEDKSVSSSSIAKLTSVKNAWEKLSSGAELICEFSTGMLYMERYESFVYKKWPYDVMKGHLCHPKSLAMAGLAFYSLKPSPSAQCQVCLTVLKGLKSNSNPWILHSEANPDCHLIKLGQRQQVDDYTMEELLQMMYTKMSSIGYEKVKSKEDILKKQLVALRKLEIKQEQNKEPHRHKK